MPEVNSGTNNSPVPVVATPSLVTEAATPPTTETPAGGEAPKVEGEAPKAEEPKVEAAAEFIPLTSESIKLPEGLEYGEGVIDEALGFMNNQELTPAERLQGLIDLQARVANAASEASSTAWNTLQEKWQGEVKADAEIGGANFQPTMTSIGKLVTEYGNDALREALDSTGAGNHPEVVRFLSKVAKQLTEGGPATGTPASQGEVGLAQKLFPSMKN